MSLLDGRYEVIAQRALDSWRTEFEATAPDGTPLRIEWFDLKPEREPEFEAYRRLLRRLKAAGLAAVHDVIARPGAHYVAWERPPADSAAVSPAAGNGTATELRELLQRAGYALESCDMRRQHARQPRTLLYGLPFGAPRRAPQPQGPHAGREPTLASDPPASYGPAGSSDAVGPHGSGAARGASANTDLAGPLGARPLRHQQSLGRRAAELLERLPERTLSWGVAGLLTLVAVVAALVAVKLAAVDAVVTVPEVIGADAALAAQQLVQLGLVVDATPLTSSEPPGTVLAIDPPTGSALRPGRTVLMRYALPSGELAPTETPSLLGLSYPEGARAALEAAGLRLGDAAHIHAPSPAGTVLAQDIDAGNRVANDTAVSVLVSVGPRVPQTFVPNLVGLDLDEAKTLARLAGISEDRVVVDELLATAGANGQVLEQSLAPYVPVARDTAVLRLVVQAGEPTGPAQTGGAPDVVGLDLAAAREVASGWDLEVRVLGNPGLPEGVVAQDPVPGGPAGAARTLVITVNAHPVRLSTSGVYAVVRGPEPRTVEYAWAIQPGIGLLQAEVWASDLEGRRILVSRASVRGGDILRGEWRSTFVGPVRFELLLGGVPYGEPLLVP